MKIKDLNDQAALTTCIWLEARGEDFIGKLAVALVVRNRTKDPRWPKDYKGVIFQPMQFSCFNDWPRDCNLDEIQVAVTKSKFTNPNWKECHAAAFCVLNHWIYRDITGGANHYHTHAVHPYWSDGKYPCFEHGGHKFFRL